MVNGSSNVRANDHCFHASSTQFYFSYDFHQIANQISDENLNTIKIFGGITFIYEIKISKSV